MASNSKLPEGLYIFEQPFLRAPNETLRRHFRATQKVVEKDFTALRNAAKEHATGAKKTAALSASDVVGMIDSMIGKVEGLHKKIQEVHSTGTSPTVSTLRKRFVHLEELDALEPQVVDDVKVEEKDVKMEDKEVELPAPPASDNAADKASDFPVNKANDPKESKDKAESTSIVGRDLSKADVSLEAELEGWTNIRLDRWLVDWCLRKGMFETAELLATERGITDLVDIPLFTEIRRIESALRAHSCTEALAWCSDNKNALRKLKSTLEFELRLQEYIELARAEKTLEALSYWKKHLAPWSDSQLHRMKQAAGLIAFSSSTRCRSYQRLYSTRRYDILIETFRKAIYNLHSLPERPLLHYALSAGLTALKLPACLPTPTTEGRESGIRSTLSNESSLFEVSPAIASSMIRDPTFSREASFTRDTIPTREASFRDPSLAALPFASSSLPSFHSHFSGLSPSSVPRIPNPDCPVCDHTGLGVLAQEVPFSHHANSVIVCRITGEIMDASNGALAFPNGMVYSEKALSEMAAKNGGIVKCPRTGMESRLEDLRKVFVS